PDEGSAVERHDADAANPQPGAGEGRRRALDEELDRVGQVCRAPVDAHQPELAGSAVVSGSAAGKSAVAARIELPRSCARVQRRRRRRPPTASTTSAATSARRRRRALGGRRRRRRLYLLLERRKAGESDCEQRGEKTDAHGFTPSPAALLPRLRSNRS